MSAVRQALAQGLIDRMAERVNGDPEYRRGMLDKVRSQIVSHAGTGDPERAILDEHSTAIVVLTMYVEYLLDENERLSRSEAA